MTEPPLPEESIFARAREIASAAERAAFLDRACGDDPTLRAEVEALLRADDRAGDLLDLSEGPADGPDPTDDRTDVAKPAGQPLAPDRAFAGRFKLRQRLGEGGMGEVWVADQVEPVHRRVAVKVVRPGLDSDRMLARFEAERQALALMDHPHIARVLDAGEADGRPYFVMELIKGVPITEYCDRARLSPRERLALFVPVCEAVQHAHQKGVIHRDLKPSNILVALYDGRPVPKVIDFGIAKATGPRLTERSVYTEVGSLIGTLEYMAPEQAELNNLDVDTRADVYALGAILYELLTGTVPFSRAELQAAGFVEMLRVIKEVEPPRPSTRLSGSGTLPNVAAVRHTEPQKLVALVRGELDWIVLKCLEKDRSRRYETASGLARDVERYLASEPVEACPPTAGYRLRKLARRYRTPVAVAGAFALLLIVGAAVSTWQAVRATAAERAADGRRREADEARGQAERRRDELARLNEEMRRTHYVADMNLARVAWDENNVGLSHELLGKYRPRAGEPDLRGFEWYYLDRLARGGELRIDAHGGGVDSVAFLPDGKRLISAGLTERPRSPHIPEGTAGAVKLWGAATGRPLPLRLDGPSETVAAVVLSPDGTRLAATRRDHTVLVWDLATGGLVTLEGSADRTAFRVQFRPDGRRLVAFYRPRDPHSGAGSGSMTVWDPASREPIVTVDRLHPRVWGGPFSPDGKQLFILTAIPPAITVYDAETGRQAFSHKVPEGAVFVTAVVFSPDGKRLATSDDRGIHIWDTATREPVAAWPTESEHVLYLVYSPDGRRLASGGLEGFVEIWDTRTGRKIRTLKGHAGRVLALAFSPDGRRLATGGADGTLRVWDVDGPGEAAAISDPGSGLQSVIPDLSPDGRSLFAVQVRGLVRRRVELWDTATHRMRGGPIELTRWCLGHDWSADGSRLYLADEGKTVHVIETASARIVRRFQVDAEPQQYATALSPDEKWYVHSGPGGTLRVRDARTGAASRTIRGFDAETQALAFSPDGARLIGADLSGNVKLWDFATGREVVATTLAGLFVNTVRFSRDGARVALMGNRFGVMTGELRILDAGSAREVWSLRGHTLNVTDADFSPDGRRLVTAGADRTVRVWDLAVGQETLKLRGDPHVTTVRFDSGGRRLIGGSMERTIRVWDAAPRPE